MSDGNLALTISLVGRAGNGWGQGGGARAWPAVSHPRSGGPHRHARQYEAPVETPQAGSRRSNGSPTTLSAMRPIVLEPGDCFAEEGSEQPDFSIAAQQPAEGDAGATAAFPYDRMTVERFRSAFPSARWRVRAGRKEEEATGRAQLKVCLKPRCARPRWSIS
jgi:hypothetical protein